MEFAGLMHSLCAAPQFSGKIVQPAELRLLQCSDIAE